LRIAEQQDVVGKNGLAGRKIREISALASACSGVLPLPKLPPLSPARS
jgi:hypothetical protein